MTTALHKIWCDEDEHFRYEHFADFNEWLDSEEITTGSNGRFADLHFTRLRSIQPESTPTA